MDHYAVLFIALAWVLFAAMSAERCVAAEWSLTPSLSTKGYYSDNLLLTDLPHDPTYGYWVSPSVEFAGNTEKLDVSGKAALDFVDYYGGEKTSFTNVSLPLTARYRSEKDEWGFRGGFIRDNTLLGELLATGLVLRFTQRNYWTVNPTWTRMLTEKLGFQGAFQFNDASYKDGIRLGLLDYQVVGGSAGLLYRVTEKDEIQLAGTYSNFHTRNAPYSLHSSFPGFLLTHTHSFTESLKATVFGGPRFISSTTKVAGSKQTTADTTWVYGADVTQRFENAVLQFTVSRDIMPSGFGLLVQTDRIGLVLSYDLSETLTASLDSSGYLVSGASPLARGGSLSENRLFYSTPAIAWKFTEWWKLEASYSYRWRDADGLLEPVMANSLMMMLTYYPHKLAFSN